MAIDNELEDEQKAIRIEEVHQTDEGTNPQSQIECHKDTDS